MSSSPKCSHVTLCASVCTSRSGNISYFITSFFSSSSLLCSSVHLKMFNDASLFLGVPEPPVPECQCLWCSWMLREVQWTWGECKRPFSSLFSGKLCTAECYKPLKTEYLSIHLHFGLTHNQIAPSLHCNYKTLKEEQWLYSAACSIFVQSVFIVHLRSNLVNINTFLSFT